MVFSQFNKNHLLSQLKAALIAAEVMPVTKSCHDCANYDLRGGPARCRVFDAAPPVEVVEIGCDSHIHDHTIPPF